MSLFRADRSALHRAEGKAWLTQLESNLTQLDSIDVIDRKIVHRIPVTTGGVPDASSLAAGPGSCWQCAGLPRDKEESFRLMLASAEASCATFRHARCSMLLAVSACVVLQDDQ